MAKKKFVVIYNMQHDGKRYKAGDSIEVEAADVQELIDRGVLAASKKEAVPANSGMPEPAAGTYKEEETATQLTADPGSDN